MFVHAFQIPGMEIFVSFDSVYRVDLKSLQVDFLAWF